MEKITKLPAEIKTAQEAYFAARRNIGEVGGHANVAHCRAKLLRAMRSVDKDGKEYRQSLYWEHIDDPLTISRQTMIWSETQRRLVRIADPEAQSE